MSEQAMQVPLIELLRGVPRDARLVIEDGPYSTSYVPVGRYCHEAAAALSTHHASPGTPQQEASGETVAAFLELARLYCSVTETPSGDVSWTFATRDIEGFAVEVINQHRSRAAATEPAGGVTDWPAEAKDIADAIDSFIRAAVAPDWDNLKSWRNHLRRLIQESAQGTAARAAEPAGGVTEEAQREGYDDVESYVAALKQSRDTYFAERNSARDAYRRHRDESDSRGRLINVVLGLVDAPPGANVVQAVAAALTTAARAAEPAGGVTEEAQREGYDDVESYVAALKQSRDTYFAERNSARDAYRRHRDESDSRGRLINVVLGLVDAPPGANVVQAVAAALTTAARAAEPKSEFGANEAMEAIEQIVGEDTDVLLSDEGQTRVYAVLEQLADAASPTPPTGTSQGEGTP